MLLIEYWEHGHESANKALTVPDNLHITFGHSQVLAHPNNRFVPLLGGARVE